jgi:hypothetical protein
MSRIGRSSGPPRSAHSGSESSPSRPGTSPRTSPARVEPLPISVVSRGSGGGWPLHGSGEVRGKRHLSTVVRTGGNRLVHSGDSAGDTPLTSASSGRRASIRPLSVDSSRSCPQECAQTGDGRVSRASPAVTCTERDHSTAPCGRTSPTGCLTSTDVPRAPTAGLPTTCAAAQAVGGGAYGLGTSRGCAGDDRWTQRRPGAQPSRCPRVDNRRTPTAHTRPTPLLVR